MKETMNPNTRCVSFVENLQLEISDSLFNESILLADVDNDDDYELVVGQINGDLLIFKGSSQKPWRTCRKLGMITCVGVGDLWNQGENLLFCITAEGWCHMFYVSYNVQHVKPIGAVKVNLPSRPTYLGRYIGRVSSICRPTYRSSVGRYVDRCIGRGVHKLHTIR